MTPCDECHKRPVSHQCGDMALCAKCAGNHQRTGHTVEPIRLADVPGLVADEPRNGGIIKSNVPAKLTGCH
jgi:hypothetical protein